MTLADIAVGRDNNFNLVRIIAAYAVLFTHSFALAIGTPDAEPRFLGLTFGAVAVHIFFVTSGFLVTASIMKRKSFVEFVWARFLRIFPALFVVIALTVFGLGVYFTTDPILEYLRSSQTARYLAKSGTLLAGVEYNLPGVFDENPYKNAVNGSLWTLPHELRLYALLAVSWLFLKLFSPKRDEHFFRFILFVYLIAGFFSMQTILIEQEKSVTLTLLFLFFSGSVYFVFREKILISQSLFILFLTLLIVSMLDRKAFEAAYLILLPYLVFYIAYVPSGFIRRYNSLGDYSYGVYIYAFPVQQSIAALIPNIGVGMMFAYSGIITLLLAALSWHLLEKRALMLKPSCVGVTRIIYAKMPDAITNRFGD